MEVRIPTLTASQEVMLTALALTWKSTTCWRILDEMMVMKVKIITNKHISLNGCLVF